MNVTDYATWQAYLESAEDTVSERNMLANGRFLDSLDSWDASGAAYLASDGGEQYGVAALAVGNYVEQDFSVPFARAYTLSLTLKGVSAAVTSGQVTARIVDGDGATVATLNPVTASAGVWAVNTFTVGLAPGVTYTLRVTNVSVTAGARLDDVWLWWVPKTRAQMAATVHGKLGRLATSRSYSTTPSGTDTEGDYTDAIDAGLRAAGAVDPETDTPDVRWLETATLDTALEAVERSMLERLQRDYAVEVDTSVGPMRQSLSQVRDAIGTALDTRKSGGGRGVVVRKLVHDDD